MDDISAKEILRLAHKLPSPRSVTDTAITAALHDDDNAAVVNMLAKSFLYTVVRYMLTMMQDNQRMTVYPLFVSQALEYFIKFDVAPYRHSYMLDNNEEPDGSEESSDQSAWSVKDDIMDEDDHLDEDDYHLNPESEVESDNDEDDEMFFAFKKFNDKSTPNFDATFEPVGKINLSDEDFFRGTLIDVMNSMEIGIKWAGGAEGKLKRAMYAFLVAQMK
eukprot:scaffold3917_cov53-Attheya_sp.AAC.3